VEDHGEARAAGVLQ